MHINSGQYRAMRTSNAPRAINLIVIHCTDTPNGRPHTAADIDRWHRERGFAKIGYHHVIRLDGTVEDGRRHGEIGAHALNFNSDSLGIALIGRSAFYPAQWDALGVLVQSLCQRYGIQVALPDFRWSTKPRGVIGHRDLPKTQRLCPGFSVADWLNSGKCPKPEHVLEGDL